VVDVNWKVQITKLPILEFSWPSVACFLDPNILNNLFSIALKPCTGCGTKTFPIWEANKRQTKQDNFLKLEYYT
jgi:hypothetical protein